MADQNGDELTSQEIDEALSSIRAGLDGVEEKDQLGYLKGRLAGLNPKLRLAVEPLVLRACDISKRDSMAQVRSQLKIWERATLAGAGVVLLVTIFVTAFKVPNPTQFQHQVFCVILAIAAAAAGAVLPGFIRIESKSQEYAVRAGGAFALLVLVYLTMCR